MFKRKKRNARAFTLIELMVVMAIIAILLLLAAPRFIGYTKDATDAKIKTAIKGAEQEATAYFLKNEDTTRHPYTRVNKETLQAIGKGGTLYTLDGKTDAIVPDDYYVFKEDAMGTYYASPSGMVYFEKDVDVLIHNQDTHTDGTPEYGAEFEKTVDLAPLFDKHGIDSVTYTLSFEAKTKKETGDPQNLFVYLQSGNGTKYWFINKNVNITSEFQKFVFNDEAVKRIHNQIDPDTKKPYETAHLSFFGGYGTGNVPVVKNIKLKINRPEMDSKGGVQKNDTHT